MCLGASWHGSWKGSCKGCACALGACKGRGMLTEGSKEEQGLNLCMGTAPGASPRPDGTHRGTAGCLLPHSWVLLGALHRTVAHQEPRGAARQALKIRRGIHSDLWCLSRAGFNTALLDGCGLPTAALSAVTAAPAAASGSRISLQFPVLLLTCLKRDAVRLNYA